MSLTRQVTVWCDECGNWEQASVTAAKLRRDLKKRGWTCVRGQDNGLGEPRPRDYCPTCSKRGTEEKATEVFDA